jgi:hypothetical protein
MEIRWLLAAAGATVTVVSGVAIGVPDARPASAFAQERKGTMTVARGEFDVKMAAQQDAEQFASGRMTIDKQFRGDLEGTSVGQMLSWLNAGGDSGGYVAIERVTATLNGRKGTFALQHSSTVFRGAQEQLIIVVPGSGGGDLAGLTGSMTIAIEDRKHFYTFSYRLEEGR